MKLYEIMKLTEADFDTYDTEIDTCVTVCFIDEDDEMDNYDKFCNEIMKKVEVIRVVSNSHLVCDWSKLIRDNMEKFRAFSMEHWAFEYDDEEEFIYQWIKEIHYYMAGYVDEDFYDVLVKFVEDLKA